MKVTSTLKLSEKELVNIVENYLKSKKIVLVGPVAFNVGTRCVGYGQNERDEAYFSGASVEIKVDLGEGEE